MNNVHVMLYRQYQWKRLSDPDEECYYSKHVDHAVYLCLMLINYRPQLQSSSWVYTYHLYFYNGKDVLYSVVEPVYLKRKGCTIMKCLGRFLPSLTFKSKMFSQK